ncbi:MAG: multidrug efflux SMR transporter [Alistipes senegalensis]|nr:multidrug efflux SMR transporter [Alistipes senegalensis]
MTAWFWLFAAGLLEVVWAVAMKVSQGMTRKVPAVVTVAGILGSFYFLGLSLADLPLGTAYAIWTGTGTLGAAVLGMALFREPAGFLRFLCIALILAGTAGLKFLAE